MSQPFGAVYADSYDLIYRDKDYAAESTLIESIFRTYNDTIRSVLDWAVEQATMLFRYRSAAMK